MNVIEVKDRNRTLSIAVEDTGDVHSDTEASKPVLFFVHGLALDHVLWKYAIEYLRADFRCIAIDLPGHGASAGQRPEQAGNFTMSFYAGIVRSCIEKLGLKDVTLAGHSMGAQISIITALQIPSLVQRLVLVSPAGIEKFIPEEAAKIEVGTEMLYRAPMDVKHILGMYAPQMNVHAERARELANDHIYQQTEKFATFSETIIGSVKGMLNEPVIPFLNHIHQPCLVIFGENDQLIPNRFVHPLMNVHVIGDIARQKIRKAAVHYFSQCGHYVPFEKPHEFSDELRQFFLSTED